MDAFMVLLFSLSLSLSLFLSRSLSLCLAHYFSSQNAAILRAHLMAKLAEARESAAVAAAAEAEEGLKAKAPTALALINKDGEGDCELSQGAAQPSQRQLRLLRKFLFSTLITS